MHTLQFEDFSVYKICSFLLEQVPWKSEKDFNNLLTDVLFKQVAQSTNVVWSVCYIGCN